MADLKQQLLFMVQTNRRPDTTSDNKNIDQVQVRQNAWRNY